jgi:regulatory protein
MQVTALTYQKKNPDRVNIFVDGIYFSSLSVSQILEQKLKVGITLDEADKKQIIKLSGEGKLEMRALNWLLLRPRSVKELSDYLKRKSKMYEAGIDDDVRTHLIRRFRERSLLNDETFAKWWIDRPTRQLKSKQILTQELRQKGVDDADIRSVLANKSDGESLLAQIEKLKSRKKYAESPKKLTDALVRRGFSYSSVREALAGSELTGD